MSANRKKVNALESGETGSTFIVGTFPGDPYNNGSRRKASAYTYWYNPEWKGCIEYEVMAMTGKDAKRAAIKARRQEE